MHGTQRVIIRWASWRTPGFHVPFLPPSTPMADEPTNTPTPTETAPATSGVVSEDQVKLALRRVKDPDLQLNIMDLGLVYNIAVDGTTVKIDMTLTSPAC